MRHLLILCLLSLAAPASAFGPEKGPVDEPRVIGIYADVEGYELIDPERYGTPAEPFNTELGAFLLVRMFRNVCIGLEQGKSLDAVMPPGFAAHSEGMHQWGEEDPLLRGTVLSSTGSVEEDEAGGHPWITLLPRESGMLCKVEWQMATAPAEDRQDVMARVFNRWLPWELAMVRATKPGLASDVSLVDFREWDRPCKGQWCPAISNYRLESGYVWLETWLNGTQIEDITR